MFWKNRIQIKNNEIHIKTRFTSNPIEVNHVFEFESNKPILFVYENFKLRRKYHIESLHSNKSLRGQFLHSSVRLLKNNAFMLDGIISNKPDSHPSWKNNRYEGLRFQPFYLSNKEHLNKALIGKGLFERGLHFSGTITPNGVRSICICDLCNKSFTLQHLHAGVSEIQYFYSSNSKETLIVEYDRIKGLPRQLEKVNNEKFLKKIESQLPKSKDGEFRYFNSFRCPYCNEKYIDFESNKEMRPNEYYCCYLINSELIKI